MADLLASGWWSSVSILLSLAMFLKILEIFLDMFWMWKNGHAYSRALLRELGERGFVDIAEQDQKHRRPQLVWRWGSRRRAPIRLIVDFIYRVPTLVLLQGAILLAALRHLSQTAIVLSIFAVFVGITVSVANAFAQRLFLGWFDPYKRELSLRPSGKYILREDDIRSSRNALARTLFALVTLIYQSIGGYACIYLGLHHLDPAGSFGFDGAVVNPGFLRFLYFSSVTAATVGFGDITPTSTISQSLVTLQILTGPLLLTLLVLAISYSKSDPLRERSGGEPI